MTHLTQNNMNQEIDVKPISEIMDLLRGLQAFDTQIKAILQSHAGSIPKQKSNRLRSDEQEKLRNLPEILDSLRTRRNQTKGALELCRNELLKTEKLMKQSQSPLETQAIIKKMEQLKLQEKDLDSKERLTEKEQATLQGMLEDIRQRQSCENAPTQTPEPKMSFDAIQTQIQEIEGEKQKIISEIPVSYFQLYQNIAAIRGGIGFTQIRNGACGGCCMTLPAQFVNLLLRKTEIKQCPNCGRLLGA